MPHQLGPAERLEGQLLNDEWMVIERVQRDSGDTGQSRCSAYRAISRSGTEAFVKAFDFRQDDVDLESSQLERNVREFNYEKRVSEFCRGKELRGVTQIYDHGKLLVDGYPVHFLVSEWGGSSLRRSHPPGNNGISVAHRLTVIKNIAIALDELHRAGVAHQDLKPSNVVYSGQARPKITDLGSSSCRFLPSPPHDEDVLVGQINYAPYEALYPGGIPSCWHRRRMGCDAFLLGNLIFTIFVGGSLTVAALHWLPETLRPIVSDTVYQEVIPDLIEAHHGIVQPLLDAVLPDGISKELAPLVLALCHPDFEQRGLARIPSKGRRELDLHRCIGTLNTLAFRAELIENAIRKELGSRTAQTTTSDSAMARANDICD